jgi:hypothetical protein
VPPNKPVNKKALFDEAIKQMKAGKYGRVSSVLKELLAVDPSHQEGRRLFATMHLKLGNLITARAILETLAQEAIQRQDHRLAEAVLREYLAAAPRCLPFLELLGQVCEDKGDAQAAVTEYGKAIEMVLEDPEPDRPTLAADLYVKVKRLTPSGPVAKKFASIFEPPPASPPPPPPSISMEPKRDTLSTPFEPPPAIVPPEPFPVAAPPPPKPAPLPPKRTVAPEPPPKPAPPPSAKEPPASPPQSDRAAGQSPPVPSKKGRASPFRLRPGERGEADRPSAATAPAAPETPPKPARDKSKGGGFRFHGDKGSSSLLELLHEGGSADASGSATESTDEGEPTDTEDPPDSPPTEVESRSVETEALVPPPVQESMAAPSIHPVHETWTPPVPEPLPAPPPPVEEPAFALPLAPVEEATPAPSIHPVHETWTPPVPEPLPAPPPPVEEPAFALPLAPVEEATPAPSIQPAHETWMPPTLAPIPLPPPPVEQPTMMPRLALAEGTGTVTPSVEPAASMPVLEMSPVVSEPVLPPVEDTPVMPSVAPAQEAWTAPSVQPLSTSSTTSSAPSGPSEFSSSSADDFSSSASFIQEDTGSLPSLSERLASRLRVGEDGSLSMAGGKAAPRVEEAEPIPTRRKAPSSRRKVVLQAKTAVLVGRGVSAVRATARAIMTAVLAVLGLITVVIVGPAILWLSVEESVSDVAQHLKQPPPRSMQDPKRNGYLLLMGFGAGSSADPVKEGYERWKKSSDNPGQGCSGVEGEARGPLNFPPDTQMMAAWFLVSDPAARFHNESARTNSWISQNRPLMERYRQWLAMPFDDWGYGQLDSPDCAQVLAAHRLYVAEGFHQGMEEGLTRLERDVAAWRSALGQARTLAVKDMANTAFNEDLMVVAGLLSRAELRGDGVVRLLRIAQPLNAAETALRWPMQNAFVLTSKKIERGVSRTNPTVEQSFLARALTGMPLPKQRVINGYARFYEEAIKSSENSDLSFPSLHGFTRTPPQMVVDYLINPIDNYLIQIPKPTWEQFTGMMLETETRVKLVAMVARLRSLSGEGNLLARVAKAGQNFFDPFSGLPMLLNQDKKRLYSVGRDRKDDNGDPRLDISVPVPVL